MREKLIFTGILYLLGCRADSSIMNTNTDTNTNLEVIDENK